MQPTCMSQQSRLPASPPIELLQVLAHTQSGPVLDIVDIL